MKLKINYREALKKGRSGELRSLHFGIKARQKIKRRNHERGVKQPQIDICSRESYDICL